ncbi:hypothetical protein ACFSJY_02450 [Thalassotalea euphylliae]|uniref:hypothetical protein n=1 Tax=Thalassotalea euphylliae TaxID=1655234 RepID=UPI00363349D8
MKTLIQLFILSLAINNAHAGLIEANYSFDGTNLTLESGEDIRNTNFNVGDTLTLSFSAGHEGSYWDFSGINDRSYEGFDLVFDEYANRQIDGHFYYYYDDALVRSSYYYVWDDGFRGGPYSTNVIPVDFVDMFKIEYTFFSSTAASDFITTSSNVWSIWDTFGVSNFSVPYVNNQTVDVEEPGTLALFALSVLGFAGFNAKRKAMTK